MPGLFDRYTLKGVTLRNRIAASPMCQYMADDGFLNAWHQTHYTTLAKGGAGLVVLEATAISPAGRITPGDTGIWSDAHVPGLAAAASAIRTAGAVPGIQLAHAGRKAGCLPPWEGGAPLPASDPRAWTPLAPSALPFIADAPHMPAEMSLGDIARTQQEFADAALRALRAGFEWIELHFAHGFLAQSFLSRHSNQRTDHYGGSLENRARFLVETVAAVRAVWPASLPLTARLGVVEFNPGQEASLDEAFQVLQWLQGAGLDLVDAGLALSTATEQVPWGRNLMVPYAAPSASRQVLPWAPVGPSPARSRPTPSCAGGSSTSSSSHASCWPIRTGPSRLRGSCRFLSRPGATHPLCVLAGELGAMSVLSQNPLTPP